jgi:hypothetical protein
MEIKFGPVIIELELLVFAYWGVSLMGTGQDTFIAAEETSANLLGQIGWELGFVFYRQIADTLIGVKVAIGHQSTCWAGS